MLYFIKSLKMEGFVKELTDIANSSEYSEEKKKELMKEALYTFSDTERKLKLNVAPKNYDTEIQTQIDEMRACLIRHGRI